MGCLDLRSWAPALSMAAALVLTSPATAAQIHVSNGRGSSAMSAHMRPVMRGDFHRHRFFAVDHRRFGFGPRVAVGAVGVGFGGGYGYPYPCNPYYDTCCPSYPYYDSYYGSACPAYYGDVGPFVGFGFNEFAFAQRFPHRRFFDFDDRFHRFDGRFAGNRGFFPGRFAMQPGMGRAFAASGGFHGGFAHGGGAMFRR